MPTRIQEETSNSKDHKNSSVPNKELKTKNTSKEMQTTKDQHKSKSDIEIRNETNQNSPKNKLVNTENIKNIQKSNDTNNVVEKATKHSNVHNINLTQDSNYDNITSDIVNTNTEICKTDNYKSDDSSQMTELLPEEKIPTKCGCCGVKLNVRELYCKTKFFKECKSCQSNYRIKGTCISKLLPSRDMTLILTNEEWKKTAIDYKCYECVYAEDHEDEPVDETNNNTDVEPETSGEFPIHDCGFCGKGFKREKNLKNKFCTECNVCKKNFRIHSGCIEKLLPKRNWVNNPMTMNEWKSTKIDLHCKYCQSDCFWCNVNHSSKYL